MEVSSKNMIRREVHKLIDKEQYESDPDDDAEIVQLTAAQEDSLVDLTAKYWHERKSKFTEQAIDDFVAETFPTVGKYKPELKLPSAGIWSKISGFPKHLLIKHVWPK